MKLFLILSMYFNIILCVPFLLQPDALTVASVAKACSSSDSAKDLQISINDINQYNALIDVEYPFIGRYHFNNEEFWPGQDLITAGVSAVKNHAKQQNYQAARAMLGKTLHTLQVAPCYCRIVVLR